MRSRRSLFLSASALALVGSVLLGACGSVAPYAAEVNGTRITPKSITDELSTIRANRSYTQLLESRGVQLEGSGKGTFNSAYTAQVLTRRIFYQLIGAELARRKISFGAPEMAAARAEMVAELTGEEVLKAFPKAYQDTLVRRRAQFTALATALGGEGGGGDARGYYNTHQSEFEQACVSAILAENKDKADKIEARLAKGEDFAAVAKAESKDPSAPKGGDLGCEITHDTQADPEFIKAVFAQAVGQVGPPVQTNLGLDIVKVVSRTVPPFEKVMSQAQDKVLGLGQERLVAFIQEGVVKAKVKVNPTFGRFDPSPPAPRVVPPEEPGTVPQSVPHTPSSVPAPQP